MNERRRWERRRRRRLARGLNSPHSVVRLPATTIIRSVLRRGVRRRRRRVVDRKNHFVEYF